MVIIYWIVTKQTSERIKKHGFIDVANRKYFQILFLIVGLFENLEIALDSLAVCGAILRCVLMISFGFNAATRYVLSWTPRALYFPGFATAEQCESIIKMAKVKLAPSNLALRKGETAENTKGIRTSLDMFISASEDKTGILDQIEKKIERATIIPRSHGEGRSLQSWNLLELDDRFSERLLFVTFLSFCKTVTFCPFGHVHKCLRGQNGDLGSNSEEKRTGYNDPKKLRRAGLRWVLMGPMKFFLFRNTGGPCVEKGTQKTKYIQSVVFVILMKLG
ncbi:putative procollagen-proline 4-dioxygenase [Helianthus annuus]|nr:putative procollagen-proline 4-dioxygenase [Helianthus annuus]KAJ0619145.1 putative procollagen-proline 4-dioxygenase [Helianthus annuus]KAJ0777594.1 putative procollagen-proline 4-dioxygenase [Helianthus annuus]KAJ0786623.1 putative procollagen-proline 4-dioxygenase [Helianthus annuus]